jgi:rare lipoprotein A
MKRLTALLILLLFVFSALMAADAPLEPGTVIEKGIASWYTTDKSESLTANGEIFDPNSLHTLTAA